MITLTRRPLAPIGTTAGTTLPSLLLARAAMHPERPAFRHKDLGVWQTVTWTQYADQVRAVAHGLRDLGIDPGDRVAIHSENRPEWVYADLATEALGGVVVGVYPTNPSAEVRYMLQNSGATVLIAEDQEQVDKALAVFDECPDLRHIVVIDPKGMRRYDHPALIPYDELVCRGRAADTADREWLDSRAAEVSPDDVSCIVYTSGTTGPPKGAMLTHRNCLAGARAFVAAMGIDSTTTAVSYLPLCHIAERMWTIFISLLSGVTISFAESVDTVQQNIHEIAPTFFGAVPRIAEKMQASVEIKMQDAAWMKRKNYAVWMRVGRRLAGERIDHRGSLCLRSRLLYRVGDVMLYRAMRERLGLRNVRHCIFGAAPPAPELLEYFHAIGVRVVQVYGQTECGGGSHMHHGWDIAYDTVGTELPGYQCTVEPQTGEVLLRGEGVFAGYWRNPDATAATVRDGWLHTGDQGTITDRGHLKIVGRLKDIIITSGGKNVSPDYIENELKFSPYVREAIVIGEGRKYLSALIGIEYDTVGHWAEQRGIPYTTYRDLSARPEVRELVADWVLEVNRNLSQVEQIKRFTLLTKELDHEDAELTATQKVRRSAVADKFGDLIEELYR
ncbi:AMP-dependent synthetase/ligase [soil metagenome]